MASSALVLYLICLDRREQRSFFPTEDSVVRRFFEVAPALPF